MVKVTRATVLTAVDAIKKCIHMEIDLGTSGMVTASLITNFRHHDTTWRCYWYHVS